MKRRKAKRKAPRRKVSRRRVARGRKKNPRRKGGRRKGRRILALLPIGGSSTMARRRKRKSSTRRRRTRSRRRRNPGALLVNPKRRRYRRTRRRNPSGKGLVSKLLRVAIPATIGGGVLGFIDSKFLGTSGVMIRNGVKAGLAILFLSNFLKEALDTPISFTP